MNIKEKQYPHPVLSFYSNQVLHSYFKVNCTEKINEKGSTFIVHFDLKNKVLEDMIQREEACFLVHVESSQAKYRTCYQTFLNDFQFSVDFENIRKTLEICFFVVSLKDIKKYKNDFNETYKHETFSIYKGDILALARSLRLRTSEKINPKKPNSIFSFVSSTKKNGPSFTYYLEGTEKIIIELSKQNFFLFQSLSKSNTHYRTMLISSIVLPVLSDILSKFHLLNQEEYEEKMWFEVLCLKLKELAVDLDNEAEIPNPLELAQKILENPLDKNLKFLDDLVNGEAV